MCELLAMSTEYATNLTLSLSTLSEHSSSGGHVDGWGVAYYQGKDIRRIRDTAAAYKSPWVSHVADHGLTSDLVIAHIRKATVGPVTLENTQPFQRELGGRIHAFAHNGDVPAVLEAEEYHSRNLRTIGTTDSEVVFCYLLERLRDAWLSDAPPEFATRWQIFQDVCAEIRPMGPANFLYSDGEYLYAHGNQRTQEDGIRRPPGMHWLCRECNHSGIGELTGKGVRMTGTGLVDEIQRVVLVASVPLTDESWEAMGEGEVLAAKGGQIVARA
jgi:glutamine amidotransferase